MLYQRNEITCSMFVGRSRQNGVAEVGGPRYAPDAITEGDDGEVQLVYGAGKQKRFRVESEFGDRTPSAIDLQLITKLCKLRAGLNRALNDVLVGDKQSLRDHHARCYGQSAEVYETNDRRSRAQCSIQVCNRDEILCRTDNLLKLTKNFGRGVDEG